MAFNEPGKELQVVIAENTADVSANKFVVPGYSVSLFELEVRLGGI
jgi:hypothetical protein